MAVFLNCGPDIAGSVLSNAIPNPNLLVTAFGHTRKCNVGTAVLQHSRKHIILLCRQMIGIGYFFSDPFAIDLESTVPRVLFPPAVQRSQLQ